MTVPARTDDLRSMPYRLAVLCYLYDADGHILLLHRRQPPNVGMYSPVGGKLDLAAGEGPHECAVREIHEETGIEVSPDDVRLFGLVSERAYEGEAHWMLFLFEITRPIGQDEPAWRDFAEGTLEWRRIDEVTELPIPDTDRRIMWPLVQSHRKTGLFAVQIDCTQDPIEWKVHEGGMRFET